MDGMNQIQPVKVLLVEDEKQMASIMRAMIRNELGWVVTYAEDGREAWQRLQEEMFDLIISDWDMPHKSGGSLLRDVRLCEKTRHLPFLMVTAFSERDRVLNAVYAGVSDYVVKPFTKKTLIDKLRHIAEESAPLRPQADMRTSQTASPPPPREDNHEVEQSSRPYAQADSQKTTIMTASLRTNLVTEVVRYFNSGSIEPPVLPHTACRVVELIKDDEVDVATIDNLIAADTATTAHLLRIANSPQYRREAGYIETLEDAIVRLGLKRTLNEVFALAYRALFNAQAPLFSGILAKLWEHALATGVCARMITEHAKLPNAEVCFTLGLLHDIGKVVLADVLLALSKERVGIDETAILHVFSALHEEFGGRMLIRWDFPAEFEQIALYHNALARAEGTSPEFLVVHLSNLAVRTLGYSLHKHDGTHLAAIESAKSLCLSEKDLNMIAANVQHEVEACKQLL
jgi:two-component system chemotaxis response regulator CheY